MRINTVAALSCAALLCSVPADAAKLQISDPVTSIRSVYATIGNKPPPDNINTPRLDALYALNDKEFGKDEVGRIDFDIYMNAQDGTLTNVKVTGLPVENGPGREIVVAKFKNEGKQQEVHFYFEKVGKYWLLDDASSYTGPDPWTLSLILKYGWDGKQ